MAIRGETDNTEEDLENQRKVYNRKRAVLKDVFLALCALEDEEEGFREAMRNKISQSFDDYFKQGTDFCMIFLITTYSNTMLIRSTAQMSLMFMGDIIGEGRINQALKATNQVSSKKKRSCMHPYLTCLSATEHYCSRCDCTQLL